MRIKNLFTVPEGQKVTEKVFGRVLLSSICSILLCMSCLAGTTWAWFTVSVENTGNEIQIATVSPSVVIKTGTDQEISPTDGAYQLDPGQYTMTVGVTTDAEVPGDLGDARNPVYVIVSVDDDTTVQSYVYTFETYDEIKVRKIEISGVSVKISFSASWIKPESAAVLDAETLVVGAAHRDQRPVMGTDTQ